jgi:hypothetical protein
LGRKGNDRILNKRKSEYFVEDSKILKKIEKYWKAGLGNTSGQRGRFLVNCMKGTVQRYFLPLIFSGMGSSQAPNPVLDGFRIRL